MLRYLLETEYEDGFINTMTQADRSDFDPSRNFFYDVLNRLHEEKHGKLVRYSCIGSEKRADIDWSTLPKDAKPIWFINRSKSISQTGDSVIEHEHIDNFYGFGYECSNNGKHDKEVLELV
jgi:hypothetical protein